MASEIWKETEKMIIARNEYRTEIPSSSRFDAAVKAVTFPGNWDLHFLESKIDIIKESYNGNYSASEPEVRKLLTSFSKDLEHIGNERFRDIYKAQMQGYISEGILTRELHDSISGLPSLD